MKRRNFIQSTSTASLSAPLGCAITGAKAADTPSENLSSRSSFAVDANRVRFYSPAVKESIKVLVVADTHLFKDDDRGEPFQQFSGRMAKAYNRTIHFQSGATTTPEESFAEALMHGKQSEVDLLALVGDIFSFPSEAAIDWVSGQLKQAGLPYLYTAGNHDWHYEGMKGSLETLRNTWIEKRLKLLYQGNHPLMAAYEVKGITFLAIDNSHYQILPEQLDFFREHVSHGKPIVLMVHIPLFAPGRPTGYGCGHPDWSAKTDRNHELERRPKWPESGHTAVTMDFHREVFAATNLLGVFAGHIHRQSIDVMNGIPQFVTNANATGAFMDVEFLPAP
ncbi:MAG: metallophosphoesterase [Akkermansiaceae bacterium]|jgi:UDP-2,3-diacylglucosamine pyrophosphatase LpxH|tara:strand:- start:3238 stop:4245 length:1008 start_codon:yes stop_codon:yes gene_type:complete